MRMPVSRVMHVSLHRFHLLVALVEFICFRFSFLYDLAQACRQVHSEFKYLFFTFVLELQY